MKYTNHYIITLLAAMLVGCSSTKSDSSFYRAESQIQPGMTKQAVYAALGHPVRETDRKVEWHGPETKIGGPSTATSWRVVIVSFDENGRVAAIRSHQEQK
jgi:outer membrane protein assembly factor BamE (lipoprotein component of BamABCDE complex)